MVEHAAEFEWRGEGEGAEVVVYAPDARFAERAFERALPAARTPGVESPVYAAASAEGFGCVAASVSHAAPELASLPVRGALLVAEVAVEALGVPPEEVERLISRKLSEVRLPGSSDAGVRRLCEAGCYAAAEDGLLEEEDLASLPPRAGDPDALGRRAISAGAREWDRLGDLLAYRVGGVHEADTAGELGLEPGMLAIVARAGAGDLGRLALAAHRDRILSRVRTGDFGAEEDLPAASKESEEAADLLAAVGAAANFADGRFALLVHALRRGLGEVAGNLSLRTAWGIGGIEEREGRFLHREDLATVEEGKVLVSGSSVVAGTGKMFASVPPFGADDGRLWQEAGLLEPVADLDLLRGKS